MKTEDRQRHTTGTLHQPNNERNREKVQSNRERRFGNQLGQGEAENLSTWSIQIQNRVCPQTLVPLFNKVKAKVPPRIEKWIMEMQDVNYELVYEPGKDEADPLDFLSRHPLPETGHDKKVRRSSDGT